MYIGKTRENKRTEEVVVAAALVGLSDWMDMSVCKKGKREKEHESLSSSLLSFFERSSRKNIKNIHFITAHVV